ncbi:MAG: substrate-binding domain-containing protein [Planctomycetaceae bacterium]
MYQEPRSIYQLLAVAATLAVGCTAETDKSVQKPTVIAMLPKLTNIAYFDACHRGAQAAAEDLGVRLIYDGPREPSGSEQNKFIESWIRQGVDAICVAPNQPKSIKNFVRRAQQRGIKVLTWDSDAPQSGRDLMVNQVDDQLLGHLLIDDIAQQMHGEGEWAIAIASLDAANLNAWRKHAEKRATEKYPKMELVDVVVTNEDENVARAKVETLLNVHPDLKGIIAFDSNSVPGAAEALKRTNKWKQVALTGNTSPQKMRPYIKQGILKSFYLWDPRELGDLTIRLAVALVRDETVVAGQTIAHHRPLEFSQQDPKMVILSQPIRFSAENIDQYDWGF